jgi:ribonuclease BN (tRNA processing enzyme)
VGTIFITHHHDDHTAGLGTLMSAAWDNQRTKPINVYGPPKTEDLVKAAVQYFTISAEIRIADGGRTIPIEQLFFGHDVGPGVIYQDANIKVTTIENTHFAFHKGAAAGKHKSYSYRFDTPGRVIVFTSDTGPFDGLVELAKGADLLVSEANSIEQRMQDLIRSGQWQVMTAEEQARIKRQMAEGHLSTEDVGKIAARAAVKTVVLSHLTWKADDDYSTWAGRGEEELFWPSAHCQGFEGILTVLNDRPRHEAAGRLDIGRPAWWAAMCMKPSLIVWALETVPDLGGFVAANDLVGKSDVEVQETQQDQAFFPGCANQDGGFAII